MKKQTVCAAVIGAALVGGGTAALSVMIGRVGEPSGAARDTLVVKINDRDVWMSPGDLQQIDGVSSRPVSSVILNSRTLPAEAYISQVLAVGRHSQRDRGPGCWGIGCGQHFSVGIRPQHTTIYTWTIPAGDGVGEARSGSVTVHVRELLWPTFPAAITRGEAFSIHGTTQPLKPGATVRLIADCGPRRSSGAPRQIGRTTVIGDGSFTVSGAVTMAGWCTVYLKVDKFDDANEAGQSGSKDYRVS